MTIYNIPCSFRWKWIIYIYHGWRINRGIPKNKTHTKWYFISFFDWLNDKDWSEEKQSEHLDEIKEEFWEEVLIED